MSEERLSRQVDGRYRIRLQKPWRDGTRDMVLEGRELIGRLATLVPPRRIHLTRYFGVFAPRAELRAAVVAYAQADGAAAAGGLADARAADSAAKPQRRLWWSALLVRVLAVDVLGCPKCSSRMQRVERCTGPERIWAVLQAAVGPPSRPAVA